MNLMDVTQEKVERALGRVVPEVHLTIAKHSVLGVSSADIAEVLGFEEAEVAELLDEEGYKEVESYIRQQYATAQADMDISWDGLEQQALQNLGQVMRADKDPDLNLRVAAIANKAQRRHQRRSQRTLVPGGGSYVQLKLTKRFVNQINGDSVEQVIEQEAKLIIDSDAPPDTTELNKLFDYEEASQASMKSEEHMLSVGDLIGGFDD